MTMTSAAPLGRLPFLLVRLLLLAAPVLVLAVTPTTALRVPAAGAPGDNPLPVCPSFPDPAAVDPAAVLRDSRVVAALAAVDAMLGNASKSIPSGLVATVVLGQQTAWTKGYGTRNVTDPVAGPPTGHDLVRVASISKVFTSLLLFLLRDAGRVGLDDAVTKWLPEFGILPSGWQTHEAVTLRSLASHTSGLPRETPVPCAEFDGPYDPNHCNETTVLGLLARKAAVLPPHTRFHYSNLGMSVLGRALGHAYAPAAGGGESGEGSQNFGQAAPVWDALAYERAVAEYIFGPLGMANATFSWNATTRRHAAVGTDMDGVPVDIGEGPTCGFGAPAGCVWASADDIARLVKLLFRTSVPASRSQGGVDGATVAEFLLPRILTRDGLEAIGTPFEMQFIQPAPAATATAGGGADVAGRSTVEAPRGFWVKGKQGELNGYRSSVTISQDLQLGIFTSALVTDVDDATVWTIPALSILGPAVRAAMADLQPAPELPANHTFFLGSYHDGSVTVALAPSGHELVLSGVADSDLYNKSMGLLLSPTALPHVLRARPGVATDCRHLDDGTDLELVYFLPGDGAQRAGNARAAALEFMGGRYERTA